MDTMYRGYNNGYTNPIYKGHKTWAHITHGNIRQMEFPQAHMNQVLLLYFLGCVKTNLSTQTLGVTVFCNPHPNLSRRGDLEQGNLKLPPPFCHPRKTCARCLCHSPGLFNNRHRRPLTQSAKTRSLDLLTAVESQIAFALLSGSVSAQQTVVAEKDGLPGPPLPQLLPQLLIRSSNTLVSPALISSFFYLLYSL